MQDCHFFRQSCHAEGGICGVRQNCAQCAFYQLMSHNKGPTNEIPYPPDVDLYREFFLSEIAKISIIARY